MSPSGPTTGTDQAELLARLRETIELLESIAADRTILSAYLTRTEAAAPGRRERVARTVSNGGGCRRSSHASEKPRAYAATRMCFTRPASARFDVSRCFTRPTSSPRSRSRMALSHRTFTSRKRRGTTGSRTRTRIPDPESPIPSPESHERQHCYVCKQKYSTIHHFYDQLCPPCAALNFTKRTELADLRGRVALLTGGRVKIGYQAGLKLLRSGARLIVTTRFPRDAAMRYSKEPDFAEWGDRLEIFGLDLRHTPSVEAFCRELLATRDRLDFIINNACQTVRRPPDFYAHMMEGETAALSDMPEHERGSSALRRTARLSPARRAVEPPAGMRAADEATAARADARRGAVAGRAASRGASRAEGSVPGGPARSGLCSRSTCAAGTRGACCSRRSRRWSCSRCSS